MNTLSARTASVLPRAALQRCRPVPGTLTRVVLFGLLLTLPALAFAGPRADLWERWTAHDPESRLQIDHSPWDRFLSRYLVTDHPSGVNRVDYGAVDAGGRQLLDDYIRDLQSLDIDRYSRTEQLPYWINLYNAVTVAVVLDAYPTSSIRRIRLGPLLSIGPWDAQIIEVNGIPMSLNDVEHRIIRPIWPDPRIHWVVNCASYGCPNLRAAALTGDNWDREFEAAAAEFMRHPRAVRFDGDTLWLSSLFEWYPEDFGDENEIQDVLDYVARYTDPAIAQRVRDHRGRIRYHYDWSLNDTD